MILELNITPTCPHVLGTVFTDEGQKIAFFRSSVDDLPNQIENYVSKYKIKDCYVSGVKNYAQGILETYANPRFKKTVTFIYI